MAFLVFMLLLLASLLFPITLIYPFSIPAVLVELVLAALAVLMFRRRRKKGKAGFALTTFTALHLLVFLLSLFSFFFISLPQHEKGDITAVTTGIKKFLNNRFGWDLTTEEQPRETISDSRPAVNTGVTIEVSGDETDGTEKQPEKSDPDNREDTPGEKP